MGKPNTFTIDTPSSLGIDIATDFTDTTVIQSTSSAGNIFTTCIAAMAGPEMTTMSLIFLEQPIRFLNRPVSGASSGDVNDYDISSFPSVSASGIPTFDLSALDSNFPAEDNPTWAYVQVVSIVRNPPGDVFETEDTTVQTVISGINNGDIASFNFRNQRAYNGQIIEDERVEHFFVPLNSAKTIAAGANITTIAGTSASVSMNLIGYAVANDLGYLP